MSGILENNYKNQHNKYIQALNNNKISQNPPPRITPVKLQRSEELPKLSEVEEGGSNTAAKVLGGTAALAILGFGTYTAVKKGMFGNIVHRNPIKPKTPELPNSNEAVTGYPEIDNIAAEAETQIQKFKNFVSGKAVGEDNLPYSGTYESKTGRVLEYKDGLLQKITDKYGTAIKEYAYDENGKIKNMKMLNRSRYDNYEFIRDNNGERIVTIKKNGSVSNAFIYNWDGSLKYHFNREHPTRGAEYTEFYDGTLIPKYKYKPYMSSSFIKYDEEGNQIAKITGNRIKGKYSERFDQLWSPLVIEDADGMFLWRAAKVKTKGKDDSALTILDDNIRLYPNGAGSQKSYGVSVIDHIGEDGKRKSGRTINLSRYIGENPSISTQKDLLSFPIDGSRKASYSIRVNGELPTKLAEYDLKTGKIKYKSFKIWWKQRKEIKSAIKELITAAQQVRGKVPELCKYSDEYNRFVENINSSFGVNHY
ncbi:hypothetical protein IKP85_06045 [bacterium]|nr:hypothetical protein [bacterium]